MTKAFIYISKCIVSSLALFFATQTYSQASKIDEYNIIENKTKNVVGVYLTPDDSSIANEPNAEDILYGKRLLNETQRLLPNNVNSQMSCNSCHIVEGKAQYGAPYINSANSYPQFNPRAGRVVTLPERINGCFQRSMNGQPLDSESREMKSMLAYMQWLAKDVPTGHRVEITSTGSIDENLVPNPERGHELYQMHCASCHGTNGEGKRDHLNIMAFPPLWGDESFNIGAGMARTYKAAAFIKYNMPMSVSLTGAWGQGGVLTDQEAVDIAAFFTHQPRPDFAGKGQDWPDGKKPKDARY